MKRKTWKAINQAMEMSSIAFWSLPLYMHYAILLCFVANFPTAAAASSVNSISGNETDQLALLAFKAKITSDPFQVLSSWNESTYFCRWRGVTCGHLHRRRVRQLNLKDSVLSGSISPYIGNLSFLRALHLQNNNFTGAIPPELGRLSRLEFLSLSNNSITGEVPANLSHCSNLVDLHFSNNQLAGKIPVELGALSKLQIFILTRNHLRGGIPDSLGNLSCLRAFDTLYNSLEGSIPESLGQLIHLEILSLGENNFSGTIPSSIFNISSLAYIDMTTNNISGSLPLGLGNTLPGLCFFIIAHNKLTGSIPASLSNASNLGAFDISYNRLTGRVPSLENLHSLREFVTSSNPLGSGDPEDLNFVSSLTNTTGLEMLATGDNGFGGVLPQTIFNLSTLRVLYLDYNRISGHFPSLIGNLVNLESLIMSINQFNGNIPTDVGKLGKLHVLDLFQNKFSGEIPSSLGNLSQLITLLLGGNNLQGTIPPSLGNCQNLETLSLRENNLAGTIPPQIVSLSSLTILLDLSANHLTGFLPIEVGNLENLGELSVAGNMLTGEIPSTLSKCVLLEILFLRGNFFQGTIPLSLSSLRGVRKLDLSRNRLSGKIPEYLGQFQVLEELNLSFNDFEGAVPVEGAFKNATATSIAGNSKLCGGVPEIQLPPCSFKCPKKTSFALILKLTIPVVVSFGLITSCFIFLCRNKRTRTNPSTNSPESCIPKVSYQRLLKATDGFSAANLIGRGSYGSVYRGTTLHMDGRNRIHVAVKVFDLMRKGAHKSFATECEALKNIRHRNIIKPMTVCSGFDFQGNDFKALVYELMLNGNLEEWLHPNPNEEYSSTRKLSLLQRLNIAIDVGAALDYLHHHCETAIVHCDVKPSNVLLDSEMTGHLADFGLATFLTEATDDFSEVSSSSSIGLRGSLGYAAPEYAMGSEVTRRGDVYSYGILLLEMFTAKRPTASMFDECLDLRSFVKKAALQGRVADIADPAVLVLEPERGQQKKKKRPRSSNQSRMIEECLVSIIRIGVNCSEDLPTARLDMSTVVSELHAVRDKLCRFLGLN